VTLRRHALFALASAAALCLPATVSAADYPSQPIRIIVPYAPAGPTDIVARVVSEKLGQQLKTSVIVENRPGGGANIGAEAAARAPADGYTLLLATSGHAINASLFPKLGYDLMRDFTPVTTLTSGPLLLVTRTDSPIQNLKDLVARAKEKPGTLSFASSGNGASTHLAGEMLNQRAGIQSMHVPYKGSGPGLTDTMSGQTAYMFDTMLSAMPFVSGGKLKALAITSPKRSPLLPQIPTVAEQGYPGFEAAAWNGIVVPAGTPAPVVAQLSAALKRILASQEVKDKFAAQGFTADWRSPEDSRAYMQSEIQRWGQIVRTANVRVD
jgi:tripartite-type tricarboxylate transporter receptor subunit TctC